VRQPSGRRGDEGGIRIENEFYLGTTPLNIFRNICRIEFRAKEKIAMIETLGRLNPILQALLAALFTGEPPHGELEPESV
jgi:hypothetical protein